MDVYYGSFRAVREIDLKVQPHKITALIGPSGCGKSTVLRSFNRMNDLVPSARVTGEVLYHGRNIYAPEVDPVEVDRKALGRRVLFHFPLEVGYRFDGHHSVSFYFDHMSNGYTTTYNEGLDTLGVRYGYKF